MHEGAVWMRLILELMNQGCWKVNKMMMDSLNEILIGMEQSVGPTKEPGVWFSAVGGFAIRGMHNIVPM